MNVGELRRILEDRKVSPAEYRILDQPDESTWCLRKQGKTWLVFYFERGQKRGLQRFNNEEAACDYLLSQMSVFE